MSVFTIFVTMLMKARDCSSGEGFVCSGEECISVSRTICRCHTFSTFMEKDIHYNIFKIVYLFELVSGLQTNMSKGLVHINV